MIDNNKAGQNILNLRKGLSLTQTELSSLVGVSHQAVSKWEQGDCLPDIGVLLKLGQVFGKSVEELLLGERVSGDSASDKIVSPPIELPDEVWTVALDRIQGRISPPSFNTWFKGTKGKQLGETYCVYSPSRFASEWLYQRYSGLIVPILEDITGISGLKVEFCSMGAWDINRKD
ncbi:chromosomal replication initiation protein [Paenibacillus sp. FSL R7-269]|uniref:helix-turn-helix transcriptional regulator n=1 Tax=Paenibacillus sp. FSL R7-269 TaxID=1226755 RepID=UPI0003E1C7D1|nr:helix-turn-helix transcriptional regulator [Paenibacillus sp. FSL R7-269]ETT48063.1 chromosomal replication initiation protein [Paenibacillus sp. FSL R7-269]